MSRILDMFWESVLEQDLEKIVTGSVSGIQIR